MNVNKHIFILLEKQNKTAADLASYIGVKPSSISAWKNENSYPSSKYIIRISEFLDVSLNYLFYGKDDQKKISNKEEELLNVYQSLTRENQDVALSYIKVMNYEQKKNNGITQDSAICHKKAR